ncbi:MAG: ZIP family metal transporter [Candidatus Margulisiibacteriota bacterium]
MNLVWLYTMTAVAVVSLISLVGIFFVYLKDEWLQNTLLFLVSFSAGALFGDAFIHLLPAAFKDNGGGLSVPVALLAGILLFFILEKVVCWRHCHLPTSANHPHPLAWMNIIGDGLHNFIDGMVIAGSFLVSLPLGVTTTIAVILHEVPQEIGEFGVLVYAGLSRGRALLFNFLSALTAFLGAFVVLGLSLNDATITRVLIPLTAGGFIYIAGSDLIPELKKEVGLRRSCLQLLFLLCGIGLMFLLLLVD